MRGVGYFTAEQAAGELGVSRATLYAYVSRGLIRSEATGGRGRRYRVEDVVKLKERGEQRRDPSRAVRDALHWGAPVLESGITMISEGHLYYRGRDAISLSGTHTAEQVAALIWTGDMSGEAGIFSGPVTFPGSFDGLRGVLSSLTPVERFQVVLPLAAAGDAAAYDLRPTAVARAGGRIVRLMAAVAAGDPETGSSISRTLREGWTPREAAYERIFDAALIICADHELPVSTFAARCVASSGATPYEVVLAGISAARGILHGGHLELVETLLREVESSSDARRIISGRLRRGEGVPGFGHSLYPEGDPRGAELLRLVGEASPGHPAVALADSVAEEALDLIGERPTVDFGLSVLARMLDLPSGGALAVFILGRTIGWIGHAIEQYEGGSMIRPRARYVGEQP